MYMIYIYVYIAAANFSGEPLDFFFCNPEIQRLCGFQADPIEVGDRLQTEINTLASLSEPWSVGSNGQHLTVGLDFLPKSQGRTPGRKIIGVLHMS